MGILNIFTEFSPHWEPDKISFFNGNYIFQLQQFVPHYCINDSVFRAGGEERNEFVQEDDGNTFTLAGF